MRRPTDSTTAACVECRAPRRLILGKKTRGGARVSDLDIFASDFLPAFCHVALDRCSPSTATWPTARFGNADVECEYRRAPDVDFVRHVAESCQLAKQYLAARRLLAFEVAMINAAEVQIVGFRICVSQLEWAPESERIRNIYRPLSSILETVRRLEIREHTDFLLNSTKYRPRIRLLTRLRPESQRKRDPSRPETDQISIPIADSMAVSPNLFTFYAHM